GLGLLVSQLNNYTLAPIDEERVSEAAGVNSAGGSFGLSFGLAFAGAIMLASLSLLFTNEANSSDVLSSRQAAQVSKALEKNAAGASERHGHDGVAWHGPVEMDGRAVAATEQASRPRCVSRGDHPRLVGLSVGRGSETGDLELGRPARAQHEGGGDRLRGARLA